MDITSDSHSQHISRQFNQELKKRCDEAKGKGVLCIAR